MKSPIFSLDAPFIHCVSKANTTLLLKQLVKTDIRIFVIDGRLNNKVDLLFSIAKPLSFPDYFGQNWDALDECLRDLSWIPAKGYALIFYNADDLLALTKKEWDTAFSVFINTAEAWQGKRVPFHVILVGERLLVQRLKALVNEPILFHK